MKISIRHRAVRADTLDRSAIFVGKSPFFPIITPYYTIYKFKKKGKKAKKVHKKKRCGTKKNREG